MGRKEWGGKVGLTATVSRTTTAASASVTLVAGVRYRVIASNNCWLRVGTAAVAAAPSMPIVADQPEEMMFAGFGDAAPVVHAIRSAADGVIYFTPIDEVPAR
jgi:hypothetical protein